MENLTELAARIKEVGALQISSTAKAVGFAIAALGTADPKALMEATGFARATLYRALAEYHEHCGYIPTSLTIPTCPTSEIPTRLNDGNCSQKPVSLVPPVGISDPAPSRVRANTELPSEVLDTKKVVKEESPFTPGERVRFENGRLELCSDLENFWLVEFGGDQKNLDLALIQSAAYVQPNSSRPLEAQIGSQLARIVRDTRDRDKRYAAAVTAKAASPPKQAKKPTAVWMRELAAEMEVHQ